MLPRHEGHGGCHWSGEVMKHPHGAFMDLRILVNC